LLLALLLAAPALGGCPSDDDDTGDDDDSGGADDDDCAASDDDDGGPDDDDGGPDDDDLGDDDDVAPGDERLAGMVFGVDGGPLAGALVGGASTDPDGWFELELAAGEQVVPFSGEGLAPAWQRTTLPGDADCALLQRLTPAGEAVSFPVLAGVDIELVSLGAAALDVAGVAWITVTSYETDAFAALPIGRAPLTVYRALRVDLADGAGQPVVPIVGQFLQIDLPLGDSVDVSTGDDLPAFRFDPETAEWVESGGGTVYAAGDGSPVWLYYAATPGLWAVGERPPVGCYSGRVVDELGAPRPAAWLEADGGSSGGLARTGADGTFVLEVAAEVAHTLAAVWLDGDDRGYLPGLEAGPTTAGEECLELGDLLASAESCVSGTVLDASMAPVEGAEVRSSLGTVLTTGVAGAYCMPAPALTRVSMYSALAPGEGGYYPWSVLTLPGSPTCAGGCPNIAVLRPYPNTTCATGTLTLDGSPASDLGVQLFDEMAPALPVYEVSSTSGGAFCSEVPSNTTVSALSADPAHDCAAVSADTSGLSTGACPTGCLDLGSLDCTSSR